MLMLRKLLAGLSAAVMSFSLFSLVFVIGLLQILGSPDNLKGLISDSGIYDEFVSGVIEQVTKPESVEEEISTEGQGGEGVSLDHPEIKAAAQTAFSPQFLQSSAESFIDGVFRWLNGDVEIPDFTINLADAKNNFAAEVAAAAKARINSLPACTSLQQINEDYDPFSAVCRPPQLNVDAEAARIQNELANNEQFFKDTTITASDLKSDNGLLFEEMRGIPDAYQTLKKLPIILAVIGLVATSGVVLLSETWRRGLRRASIVLISAGIILALGAFLVNAALNSFSDRVVQDQADNASQAVKESIANLFTSASGDVSDIYIRFGVAFAVIGIVTLIVLRFTRPKQGSVKHFEVEHPESPDNQTTNNQENSAQKAEKDKKKNQ